MPKSARKKTPIKKKSPTKKAAPAKKAIRAKSVKAAPAMPKENSGFMWKLLKKKEAEREQRREQQKDNPNYIQNQESNSLHPREQSFSKFSGPRRRAV